MPRGYLKNESELVGLKKARGGSSRRNEKRKPFRGGPSRLNDYFEGPQRVKFHRSYQAKQVWWDQHDLDHLDDDDSECECYTEFTDDDFFNHENCHEECLEHDLSLQSNVTLIKSLDDKDDESQYSMVDYPQTTSAASLSSSSWCHPISSASEASWDLVDDIYSNEDLEVVTQVDNILGDIKYSNANDTLKQQPSSQLEKNGHDDCCCICFERKPRMFLMQKCQHPRACRDCLRQHYIVNVEISDYPLQCFYPTCDRPVHDEQIRLLADNSMELQKHYRHKRVAKARRKGVTLVKCPECNYLRSFFAKDATRNIVSCEFCHSKFRIRYPEKDEMEGMFKLDPTYARCPSCFMIVFKDGGCDHMICFCGHEFDWPAARLYFLQDTDQLRKDVEKKFGD